MKLVIIGGFPRSGTRQFADILNAHDDCRIQGEVYTEVFKRLATLFKASDNQHRGTWTEKSYFQRRSVAVLESYRWVCKSSSGPIGFNFEEPVQGFKQPYIENCDAQIKTLFSPDHERCVFFYCVRNIHDNYLSLNSAFNYTTQRYIDRTKKSLSSLKRMREDRFFEIYPLLLDSFISCVDKADWIKENIFDRIPVSAGAEWCQSCISYVSNRNKTPSEKRRYEITDGERADIIGDRDLMALAEWAEDEMSIDLLSRTC